VRSPGRRHGSLRTWLAREDPQQRRVNGDLMTRIHRAVSGIILAVAVTCTACTNDAGSPASAGSTRSSNVGSTAAGSPSSTADPQRETATSSDGSSNAPTADEAACVSAERGAARNIWLWQAVSEVTSAATGHSAQARDTVVKQTAKVEARLHKACGGRTPSAFKQFSSDILPTVATDRLGNAQLDMVLAAWPRWASAVGTPKAARREIRNLESCRREFFPRFDASYRVWWKWTETGKAWWVDITFDNRTERVLDGSMGGTAKATKMLPDPFGWANGPKPGPGRNATLSWGGSSADFLELHPGRTTLRAAPDADQDVHTTADGAFRVIEITVGLAARGTRYSCSPPVRQIS
jgi:hypothetical protein